MSYQVFDTIYAYLLFQEGKNSDRVKAAVAVNA